MAAHQTTSEAPGQPTAPRRPLVWFALASMLGVSLDRFRPMPTGFWLIAAAAALFAAWQMTRRSHHRLVRIILFLAAATLAGGFRHERYYAVATDDLGLAASEEFVVCRLRGVVASPSRYRTPETDSSPFFWKPAEGWSRFELDATQLDQPDGWKSTGGRLSVRVRGEPISLWAGNQIELVGLLIRPSGPRNQGEFDYRHYLADRGVHSVVECENPQAIQMLNDSRRWSLANWREQLRKRAFEVLKEQLPSSQAALASAILLGDRTQLTQAQLQPYFQGGTIHLLVVSGLHVGVVAGLWWMLSGGFRGSLRARAVFVLAGVGVYATLTGADPPVVRSIVVAVLFFGGYLVQRPTEPINSLAAAVLIVLAINPEDLFHAGPQLSFACVLAIILFQFPRAGQPMSRFDALVMTSTLRGRIWLRARPLLERYLFVSLAVWLTTAPLVLHHFHVLAPIAVPVSALVVPLMGALLVGVALLLILAAVLPAAAAVPAIFCSAALTVLQATVEWTARLPGAFYYLPSWPLWWILGLYLLLFLPSCLSQNRIGKLQVTAALGWIAVGIGCTLRPHRPAGLEYHQLAVGHGNCSVLRLPDGRTVMYDCGSLGSPKIAESTVAPWLWANGVGSIDALFISHADVDHFGGVVDLVERMTVREVLLTPQFARSRDASAAAMIEKLQQRGVLIRPVWAGDIFPFGDVKLKAILPQAMARPEGDNAASLVLLCEDFGRKMLLTGDLEGSGLTDLYRSIAGPVDVLISPHHGGRTSNPPELADWARPQLVISTQGRARRARDPLDVYSERGAVVLRTDLEGTIDCAWRISGIEASTYRTKKSMWIAWRD